MAGSSSTSSCSLLLLLLLLAAALSSSSSLPYPATATAGGASPSSHHHHLTAGFSRVKLSEAQFVVQKPYDVPLHDRYEQSAAAGVRRMWVFSSDKPISATRPGAARTEIRVAKVYSSGVWQFEADMYVPSGTSGACVMQIFGAAAPHASTLMLQVYAADDDGHGGGGRLTYYHDVTKVVAERVYDRWVRLNVVHDVAAGNVTVFVDGERRLGVVPGHGGGGGTAEHYFKFGVYSQPLHGTSRRMESRWKNVAVYAKP